TADLEQAAALFRGDLLEGIDGVGEAFETWLMAERGRLRNRAVGVLDRLLAVRMAEGATGEAMEVALRLLDVDPLREDVHRLIMRLHLRHGRRAGALRQCRTCEPLLRRELALSPEGGAHRRRPSARRYGCAPCPPRRPSTGPRCRRPLPAWNRRSKRSATCHPDDGGT